MAIPVAGHAPYLEPAAVASLLCASVELASLGASPLEAVGPVANGGPRCRGPRFFWEPCGAGLATPATTATTARCLPGNCHRGAQPARHGAPSRPGMGRLPDLRHADELLQRLAPATLACHAMACIAQLCVSALRVKPWAGQGQEAQQGQASWCGDRRRIIRAWHWQNAPFCKHIWLRGCSFDLAAPAWTLGTAGARNGALLLGALAIGVANVSLWTATGTLATSARASLTMRRPVTAASLLCASVEFGSPSSRLVP